MWEEGACIYDTPEVHNNFLSNSPLDTFYKDFLAQLNKIDPFQEAMFICVKERQTLSATYVDLWLLIKDTPMVKQVLKRF